MKLKKKKNLSKHVSAEVGESPDEPQLLTCSHEKLLKVMDILTDRIQRNKEEEQSMKMQKCKLVASKCRKSKTLPCSIAHKGIQFRNSMISHNFEAATRILLKMMRNQREYEFDRALWKGFFLILQHSPYVTPTHIRLFKEMCKKESGNHDLSEVMCIS